MKVHVLGWFEHGNTGDEAFKVAFPMLLPDVEMRFMEFILPESKPDAVILGGGDIVYPSFTKYINNLRYSPNIRKIAHSISLTENSDFETLKTFDQVYVRDQYSLDQAIQHGVDATYQPDVTFMLTPNRDTGRQLVKQKFADEGHDLYSKVVVCVISNYLANAKLDMLARDLTAFMKLSQDIAGEADHTKASFIFLPFSTMAPWDDRVANAWVADRCKFYKKNLVVWERLTVQETLDIIAAADVCVSSRLHSTIFSTLSGVPFVDLTHHTKNLGFLQTLGKTDWSLPFWEFDVKNYRKLVDAGLEASNPNAYLKQFTNQAKGQLRATPIL